MSKRSPLNKSEKALLEAINSMFDLDAKLGLAVHDDKDQNAKEAEERGYEYLHNQIDEMFELKAAELTYAESVNQAFHKVHSYKYLDDPKFKTAMEKEMVAQAVPNDEREKAKSFIDSIIKELEKEAKHGFESKPFNPHMDEIKKVSKPETNLEFEIHDKDGYNDSNVEWDKSNASPSRTQDEP